MSAWKIGLRLIEEHDDGSATFELDLGPLALEALVKRALTDVLRAMAEERTQEPDSD